MTSLHWLSAVLLDGHGVASGRAVHAGESRTSPYPKGTIAMQSPFFAALGLDLSPFWPGTLNLSFSPFAKKTKENTLIYSSLRLMELRMKTSISFIRLVSIAKRNASNH